MNVQLEFSKQADYYGSFNIIQRRVVDKLLSDLSDEPASILDLGCGCGALYKALTWEPGRFVGVDFAPRMLELHPKAPNVECIYGDFNDPALFEHLQFLSFDRIFSASALQWSEDLEPLFVRLASLHAPVSLALFTAKTFKTLFETAGLEPLLRSSDEVSALAKRYFNARTETVLYELSFESIREMFRYIKRSGVSGRRNVLTYKQTRKLMAEYPLGYLEFEVVFVRS